jgi:thiosulfate reductase / polysulfide reductase chain A
MPIDSCSRRQFLGTLAAAGAGAAAAATPADAAPHPPGWSGSSRVEKIATICEMCFWRCGVLASVADGKVIRIEGNPDHPLTRGRLCARGNAGTGLLYDPDRLKFPMVRTGARGEGKFARITWDEALDRLASKLTDLRAAHGAESVAYFPHGIGSRFFGTLMSAFGTPNSAEPSFAQCRGPREIGYSLTFGQAVGSPEPVDLEAAKLVVLIGSHLGENVFTSQITAFAAGRARGAKVIAVDPRYSTAAAKADWWLPVRPGTDIALLLAWIHVLISERLYDQEYITTYAAGFEALAAHVASFTPEWAEAITDIPAAQIRETARAMGHAKPAVAVHPGRHVTWYGDDTQRARAMAILTALLGSYGRPGGLFLPTSVPRGNVEIPAFPDAPRGRADGAGTRFPLASEEMGVTNGLVDATVTGKPYPIKSWIVYGQNVLESLPQRARTLEAIKALDYLVVVDVMPVEQIDYADLVLPEATYLERYDPPVIVTTAKQPFVSIRQPVCEPMYESKPGWWIAQELAKRLGLQAYFPWKTPDEHLATIVEPMDINIRELMTRGAVAFPGRPYLDDRTEDDGFIQTASGKIELYSKDLEDAGSQPLPVYTPVEEPPEGYVRLIYGRAPMHSFARSQNNEALHALMPENDVWLHTSVAARLGLRDGDRAILENTNGVKSRPVRVRATEGIRRDCAYLVHGFGHGGRWMRRASGRGASDTALMSAVKVDPVMGGTGMRVNFVKAVPAPSAGM